MHKHQTRALWSKNTFEAQPGFGSHCHQTGRDTRSPDVHWCTQPGARFASNSVCSLFGQTTIDTLTKALHIANVELRLSPGGPVPGPAGASGPAAPAPDVRRTLLYELAKYRDEAGRLSMDLAATTRTNCAREHKSSGCLDDVPVCMSWHNSQLRLLAAHGLPSPILTYPLFNVPHPHTRAALAACSAVEGTGGLQ